MLISKLSNKRITQSVFPYLIYCCEIWGDTSHTYLDPLIKCQKKYSESGHFHNMMPIANPCL